jgi:HTH-type transcriptional regulator/antitoxin HigA
MPTMTATRAAQKVARPIDKPIRSRAALNDAIEELDVLIDANPKEGTAAYDRLELLSILIAAYEAEHLPPFLPPTPQEAVRERAREKGVSPGELAELMGGRSRLSDFYNSRRPLSTSQVIKLRDKLGIPADLLISRLARAPK